MKEKIAIIGSGISGLSVAYLLKNKYDLTLYEKNEYYGGHSRTKIIESGKAPIPIDTGFIVFNYKTYPNLTSLFNLLEVPVQKSKMSFGVSIRNGELEYASQSLRSLFSQFRNIFNPSFLMMIRDIIKFNRISKKRLRMGDLDSSLSLNEYLNELGVTEYFKVHYLLPMGASIWSTPMKGMYDFPAKTFIRFFNNHGLLSISCPVQWYTVKGGSIVYIKKLMDTLTLSNLKKNTGAISVKRSENQVTILDKLGHEKIFNKVIFATHSDEALSLLEQPSSIEKELLSSIPYQDNTMYLHSDESFMPHSKKSWASWVYLNETINDDKDQISLSYWMNNLQNLSTKNNYFVTLNPSKPPKYGTIHDQHVFSHPVFTQNAIDSQSKIQNIQGDNNTFYCGAYLRYGFHEDGIWSATRVAKKLGIKLPW